MPASPAFNRVKNFGENTGDRTDHDALNAELDRAALSINQLRANQALLQADDGSLKAAVVSLASLSPEVIDALSVAGPAGLMGTQGIQGIQGIQGEKGERGASFDADARDAFSSRSLYDLQPKGFSFLSLDTGVMYFKLSGDAGDWSGAYTYGKGDTGATGAQGIQGAQGAQGIQGIQGPAGAPGAAGANGSNGAVSTIDTTTKTASLVGRSSVSARLVLTGDVLSIVLTTA